MIEVEELRERVESAGSDADELIEVLEDMFAEVADTDMDDEKCRAVIREMLHDVDEKSAGSIIRKAAARDAERGREMDGAYLRLVYLVATRDGARESIMSKPNGYDEARKRAAGGAASGMGSGENE